MGSGPGVAKPRLELHPNRQPPRPPGGASASGLMRQSGIGQFDQGTPGPPVQQWGTPLDPTSGQIPGWEPGEAWPPLHTVGSPYIPDTNTPGSYIDPTSDISVGLSVQPPPTLGPQFGANQATVQPSQANEGSEWHGTSQYHTGSDRPFSGSTGAPTPPRLFEPDPIRYEQYGMYPEQMTDVINSSRLTES